MVNDILDAIARGPFRMAAIALLAIIGLPLALRILRLLARRFGGLEVAWLVIALVGIYVTIR